ncbi:MAG: hypothetical protein C5B46_07940 [Proteobacteria bacterium]|nr:MAG: hypothetical protein C5B46_07940 [Pseudomonadota bacterium]
MGFEEPVIVRHATKVLVVICLCFCASLNIQAQTSIATIEHLGVTPKPTGLTVEIVLSAPFTPQGEHVTNPDRLVFDFPGFRLQAANPQIPVSNGPVRKVRAALFQSNPPIARVVVDLKEAVSFQVKSAGKNVVIEIPYANSSPVVADSRPPATLAVKKAEPDPPKSSPPAHVPPAAHPSISAYKLQDKAKDLKLEDLQGLEDKAAAGDPEAQTTLALALHGATLLKPDDVQALRLLHKAADQGYVAAQESLGIFYEIGIGIEKPAPEKALEWYRKAIAQGSLDAATNMALMYLDGNGVPRDPPLAIAWFRKAAEGGEATAQYNLALIYARGKDVPQDYNESLRWLTAAADHDVLPAITDLASFYLHPPDNRRADVNRAIHYYEKAAGLGSVPAESTLGDIFANGVDGKPDYAQAVIWYRKAAEHRDPSAQFGLALRYAIGQGVPLDLEQAFRLFQAAADQGEPRAQYDLATMYEEGKGTPADAALAEHYFQLVAERGMSQAQFRLGRLLAGKKGSRPDQVSAYKWLMLAESTVKDASPILVELRKSLSAGEIKDAEQQVDSWRAAHVENPKR